MFDLISYAEDRIKYRHIHNNLFWFKKNKGTDWAKGQNFGDYLSLVIVGEIAKREKLIFKNESKQKLLAIGSILHFAKEGDIVWGSGVNGKISESRYQFDNLDVRMVRGTLTKQFLEQKGIKVGNTFGDPAVLLPDLFPKLEYKPKKGKIIAIPNLNEIEICVNNLPGNIKFVSPLTYWRKVINEILTSELVLSSSLHGIIIAEVFGVPVRFLLPVGGETLFKYQDYYAGTGRNLIEEPSSFIDKIDENSGIYMPRPVYNIEPMLRAFPKDLFIPKCS